MLKKGEIMDFLPLIPDSNVNSVSAGKVAGLSATNDDVAPYMLAFGNSEFILLSILGFMKYTPTILNEDM